MTSMEISGASRRYRWYPQCDLGEGNLWRQEIRLKIGQGQKCVCWSRWRLGHKFTREGFLIYGHVNRHIDRYRQRSWRLWQNYSGKVHVGPGGAEWLCNKDATSCRSVILFTGPTMGVLILANYSPIWKCDYPWESRELYQDMWRSRWSDKPWKMILEHVKWIEGYLLLNCTVSILNNLELGIRSVMFPVELWIYCWYDYWIIKIILDRGPWVMF